MTYALRFAFYQSVPGAGTRRRAQMVWVMDKTFEPSAVEARISAMWEREEAFRAGRADRAGAPPYCIVIPPPNVTGSLHMGHALNNTLQDVLCRFERMRGKDVLWQPGTDHAGIATQMVVERQLAERKEPSRRELGRERFVERVWAWKEQSGGTIINQLKRLGASCDWSRERFTMDEGLSQAVVKVFVSLYNEGLIYKDKRLVNWDPRFLTAISDLEVQQIEVKGSLWHIRYPIEGEPGRFITVATTRPETMLGDTAVAVHPEDERYRDLIGRNVVLPLVAVDTLHAGTFLVGVLQAAAWLPWLVIGLVVGAWVDRVSRWRVMLLSDVVSAVAFVSVPVAWWLGWLTVWHLFVVALIGGVAAVFYSTA